MRIGSLFSGVGGLELGLEWAGIGKTVWQVEQDDYCRRVLKRHWPGAIRFHDVRHAMREVLPAVDLICGGFPCQDVSGAGKGAGLSGARSGLWWEFARIIGEFEPSVVVVENVTSGANRWVDAVRRSLGDLGYQTIPIPLSAADCGAPHLRRRVFIIAIANAKREQLRQQCGRVGGARRQGSAVSVIDGAAQPVAAAHSMRQLQPQGCEQDQRRRVGDSCKAHRGYWAVEPKICRVAHGVPSRAHRMRALGNAVVPQCAQVVGEVLKQLLASEPSQF